MNREPLTGIAEIIEAIRNQPGAGADTPVLRFPIRETATLVSESGTWYGTPVSKMTMMLKDPDGVWHDLFAVNVYHDEAGLEDLPDTIVRIIGDDYISMERTASGQEQEYEEGDEEYEFWRWVAERDSKCMVSRNLDTGRIEIAMYPELVDDFEEAFCSEDSYINAKLYFVGAVVVDVTEILYGVDLERLWNNRPAGLRRDW